jgi:hypothetical protein
MNDHAGMELPKYRCHKEVWALKIKNLVTESGVTTMFPEDTRYAPILLQADYVRLHQPAAGGYYVVYSNGHLSFSPAEPFEEGYTLIDAVKRSVSAMVSVPRDLLKRLTTWRSCMSYNDSYFSEPAGELKRVTSELDRLT